MLIKIYTILSGIGMTYIKMSLTSYIGMCVMVARFGYKNDFKLNDYVNLESDPKSIERFFLAINLVVLVIMGK